MQMIKMFDDADGVMFVSMGYEFIKRQSFHRRSWKLVQLNYGIKKAKKYLQLMSLVFKEVCWYIRRNTINEPRKTASFV